MSKYVPRLGPGEMMTKCRACGKDVCLKGRLHPYDSFGRKTLIGDCPECGALLTRRYEQTKQQERIL